jgi:hypothetical protein
VHQVKMEIVARGQQVPQRKQIEVGIGGEQIRRGHRAPLQMNALSTRHGTQR